MSSPAGGSALTEPTWPRIISAEVETSSTDNEMITVKWKITEGKFKGVQIYGHFSIVPAALWKLKTALEALGVEPEEEDKAPAEYAEEMLEKTGTIIVHNETFEGEQRPKVTGYGSG